MGSFPHRFWRIRISTQRATARVALFAASIFAIIPVVILFMSIEKNLTSGLTAGGVKG